METILLGIEKKLTEMIRMKHYSPLTEKSYLYHWRRFEQFKKGKHHSILSSQDINDYLVFLNTKDVSDSYFNQAINAIRFMFRYVFNRKIKNYLVVRPPKAHKQPIILDYIEVQSLFNVCHNAKHLACLSLMYSCALRVSEVIDLKIGNIDSKQMIIYIRSAKGRKDRMVPLSDVCLRVLRAYWLKYKPKEYLFNGQNENPKYTAHSIQLWLKALAFKAGINKRVHPHLIRHTSITHGLEGGTDIRTLQIIAGHKNIKTTIGYTHSSPRFISSVNTPLQNIKNIPFQNKTLPSHLITNH